MSDSLPPYCNDCATLPGRRHSVNCDVARCTECGGQFISCECVDSRPTVWTGEWPGEAECREFGWYTEPDSPWGVVEDLNRLYASGEAEWDRSLQRWVPRVAKPQTS